MANNVLHVFRNIDLRSQHNGLTTLASDHDVELDKLKGSEHVIFINTQNDKVKMFSTQGVLSYYRAPKGSKLNLNMIEFIPKCFNSKGMDWRKADRMAVEKLLAKVEKKKPGLLS